ncbi:MAG TPA: TVP38/TMEM64 family protein [Verrucomicrobiae bacterium]|nr:TVP38/TMEM64 family protein [Verrucomicrobiae bacterium]
MKRFDRAHWLKLALLVAYLLVIAGVYAGLNYADIPLRDVPGILREQLMLAGPFGPILLVLFYAISTIIPFPTAAIAVLGGVLYGPWMGSVAVVIGVNLAGSISFWLARYLGRHFVSENERDWVKKYDDLLSSQGLYAVMAMRLLFFPFDVVSIGSGLTRMRYRQYVIGTFLGSLPHAISFVVLGQSFESPRSWGLVGVLMLLCIGVALLLHRSKWAKQHLFKKPVEPSI